MMSAPVLSYGGLAGIDSLFAFDMGDGVTTGGGASFVGAGAAGAADVGATVASLVSVARGSETGASEATAVMDLEVCADGPGCDIETGLRSGTLLRAVAGLG